MADDRHSEDGDMEAPNIPEVWKFAKPQLLAGDNEQEQASMSGPKIGKLVKYLNEIDDPEERDARIQERDPSTDMSLLMWATVTGRFVLVEWLVKRAKRAAFAFVDEPGHEITVFDKWIEIRKEVAEREKEKAAAKKEAAAQNQEPEEEEEDAEPELTPDQLCYEALSEYHDEWGTRGAGIVKAIGELGVFQGARDDDGAKTGLGRTLFPNGDMYTGEYRDNSREGKGTYYFAEEGMIYTGDWRNNVRQGIGRMIYADGGRYLGAWHHDRRSGDGRYTYPDGSTYSGEWQADVKHGRGTYTFTDGSQYTGLFVDGEFVSGEWLQGQSGQHFAGSFVGGVPTGKGVMTFPGATTAGSKQVGEYRGGKWYALSNAHTDDNAVLHVTLQNKKIPVAKSEECAGLTSEQLARVANFKPLLDWVASVEKERTFFVSSIVLASATFERSTNTPTSIRIKVHAVDGKGQHVKGVQDGIVLTAPEHRLAVLLVSERKTLVVVETRPALANSSATGQDNLVLPAVRATKNGSYAGAFVDNVASALRLENPTGANTVPLPLRLHTGTFFTNKQVSVSLYAQHVHHDMIHTAPARLEAISTPLVKYQCVQLSDLPAMSVDATTIIGARYLLREAAAGRLPGATAAPQRPPTPIPPPIEPRPDIEPLLEALRRKEAADQ